MHVQSTSMFLLRSAERTEGHGGNRNGTLGDISFSGTIFVLSERVLRWI